MFFDSRDWPPAPDGVPPPERRPGMGAAQERTLLWLVGLLLFAMFVAPFAGTSVILAVAALFR